MVRRARYAVWAVVLVVVVAIVWLVWTGIQALGAVTDLRSAVVDLEEGVESSDIDMVREAATAAADAAQRADGALAGPVWGLVAAVPYLGDTAEVARKTANAAATAATGLEPVLDEPVVLEPRRLYDDGRFDLEPPTPPGGLLPEIGLSNSGAVLDLMDEWDRREKDARAESQ